MEFAKDIGLGQLRLKDIHGFQRVLRPVPQPDVHVKVPLHFTAKNFTIKTADTHDEVVQALKLRYRVFRQEMVGDRESDGIDQDEFDTIGDILVIKDNTSGAIIGTYRLLASSYTRSFYSATEFDLSTFLAQDGIKLELSRACIAKEYRNGVIITLLWRGIAAYAKLTGARFLFGCTSVWTPSPAAITAFRAYLDSIGAFADEFGSRPWPNYEVTLPAPQANQAVDLNGLMPPLLKAYLRAGARVSPTPAFDRDFNCFDFFTVLKFNAMHETFDKKYRS